MLFPGLCHLRSRERNSLCDTGAHRPFWTATLSSNCLSPQFSSFLVLSLRHSLLQSCFDAGVLGFRNSAKRCSYNSLCTLVEYGFRLIHLLQGRVPSNRATEKPIRCNTQFLSLCPDAVIAGTLKAENPFLKPWEGTTVPDLNRIHPDKKHRTEIDLPLLASKYVLNLEVQVIMSQIKEMALDLGLFTSARSSSMLFSSCRVSVVIPHNARR